MTWTRSRVLIAVGLFAMAATICFELYQGHLGERSMSALLSGDSSVEIVRFESECQQRRVVCTDTEVLEHLKRALVRPAPKGSIMGGFSYVGHFKFRSGGAFWTYMQVGQTGFTVSMPADAAEEAFPTHDIVLPQPSLDKVKELFEFLQEPNQTAAGTILIMETGKPTRRENDPLLNSVSGNRWSESKAACR